LPSSATARSTGGLAYEGLNNAGASGEPLIVILNDNGMSIDRNVGAMSEHLSRLRTKPEYFAFKKAYHNALERRRPAGPRALPLYYTTSLTNDVNDRPTYVRYGTVGTVR